METLGGDDLLDLVPWVPSPATEADRTTVAARVAADPNDPNDCLTICWTSGTESEPKGVPRAHHEWLAVCCATVDAPRLVADDILLNPFPLVNMAGISGVFLSWLRVGAVLVQHHPFDLKTFLQQIQDERATYTVAPPALLWMLLHNEQLPALRDRRRAVVLADVQLDPGQADRPGDRCRDHRTGPGRRVPPRRPDRLLRLPAREQRPTPFDEDGYLCTGDLFEIAGEKGQFLHYLDRAKDLIIRGGMNIAPAELEGLIAEHPAVAHVAVVGDPDEMLGERVAAVVSLRPGVTLELGELITYLRERKFASYKLPERLEVRDQLPRTLLGKVLKRDLRRSIST